MRLATFVIGSEAQIGIVDANESVVTTLALGTPVAEVGILALLERGGEIDGIARGRQYALADVDLRAPIPVPRRNIFCIGKNYHEHVQEFARSGYDAANASENIPEHPIVFSKLPHCVIGPGDAIEQDAQISVATDYEAELGVIIGRGGSRISPSAALEHVWGYTIINDVTARDVQKRHLQWLLGKSQDTFCPLGPYAVTREEIDLANTTIRCWVNGELRQDGNTQQMIFDVPNLIATLSRGITLQVGDIIATGTPSGVGVGFKPPKFLQPGDEVKIEIPAIGTLVNCVIGRHKG